MDAAHEGRIREEVARRMMSSSALPTSALGRASRTVLGLARAGTLSLERTFRRGRSEHDVDAVSAIVASVGQLKGVTMKLGQVMGYIDVGIPADLRAGFSVLHTRAQPLPVDRIRAVIEAELGEAGRDLAQRLSPEPLSAASIGQVHRANLPDGTAVAVKVAYPGIADAIRHDFGPAALTSRLASWIYPGSHVDTFVQEVKARVLEECDYGLEARREERFAQLYNWHPTVGIPPIHKAYCSANVLTSTFVNGTQLDAFLASNPSAEARNRAGEALFDFYLGALFKHGLYNCDPHPGNYLFTADGVTFLDFGCVREFQPGILDHLAALSQAVRADDRGQVEKALSALGISTGQEPIDYESARWLLRAFYGPMLKDEVTTFDLGPGLALRELLRRGRGIRGLGMPGEFLFLVRTTLGLSAILARLGARANWYQLLQGSLDAYAVRKAAATGEAPAVPSGVRRPSSPSVGAPSGPGRYDVVLVDAGPSVIEVVRQIRDATGMSLRDVKDAIDRGPWALQVGVSLVEAQPMRERLESAGAKVDLRPSERADT